MSKSQIVFTVLAVVIAFMLGAFWYSLNGQSGLVRGEVVVNGQCPEMNESSECPGNSYDTRVHIFRPIGEEREVFRAVPTDDQGKFNVRLDAGNYVLRAEGGDPFPICSGRDVQVSAGTTTRVVLSCNTGME